MSQNKFIASSQSLLVWLRKYFPFRQEEDTYIHFDLIKGELSCDQDWCLSLQVMSTGDFPFSIKRSKIFRIINILNNIEDQPITLSIYDNGRVAIQLMEI